MRTWTVFILGALLSTSGLAYQFGGSKHIASCRMESKGECQLSATGYLNLSQTSSRLRAKNIHFTMNPQVQGVLKLYHTKTANMDAIKGEFILENTGTEKSYLQYKVVFKDKTGAVAQTYGDILLNAGKHQKKRFGTIDLTSHDLSNIDLYEIQIVEANHPLHRRRN